MFINLCHLNYRYSGDAYDRLITGVTQIGKDISFARDEHFGFATFSPEKIGNSISVSVRVKLEKLPLKKEKFEEIIAKFDLKISKPSENSETNVYEVSSKKRLGLTEFETVNGFAQAIGSLIVTENDL